MSPRVLFLDHVGVLGGGELSLLDIARHFRASSRVVLFGDGPFRARLEEEGIGVSVWPMGASAAGVTRGEGGLGVIRAVPDVFRLVGRLARHARRYDCLYANSQKSMVIAGLAGALARRPVIWHLRDLLTADHFGDGQRRLATTIANLFASRVIANSRATAEAFVAAGGREDRVRVVYNGIDPAPFEAVTDQDVARLRTELGLDGAPLIGVFSRLAPWKGQHVLIDALTALPEAHALLVGDALFGPDQGYDVALREQVARLGIGDRVHFLGFRRDVPALMRLVDVVAHTSTAPEPFGRVIVEAMLSRRPVIATDAGGAAELVDSGRTGLLVPPGDVSALARALDHLLVEPSMAANLAGRGMAAALDRFGAERMLREVVRCVDSLSSGHGVSGGRSGRTRIDLEERTNQRIDDLA